MSTQNHNCRNNIKILLISTYREGKKRLNLRKISTGLRIPNRQIPTVASLLCRMYSEITEDIKKTMLLCPVVIKGGEISWCPLPQRIERRSKHQLTIYQTEQDEYHNYPITRNTAWNLFASYRINGFSIQYVRCAKSYMKLRHFPESRLLSWMKSSHRQRGIDIRYSQINIIENVTPCGQHWVCWCINPDSKDPRIDVD